MSKRTATVTDEHLGIRGVKAFKLVDRTGQHTQWNKTFPLRNAWASAEMALYGSNVEGKEGALNVTLTEYGETGDGKGHAKSRTISVQLTAGETRILYTMLKDALGK